VGIYENYKIIIPKEEPKQKLPYWFETKEWKEFSKLADTHFGGKPKQETLEEAIKQELENHFFSNNSEIKQAEYFINFGVKYQQEQDKNKYSEEEVHNILGSYEANKMAFGVEFTYSEWFNQLKDK